MLNAPYVGGDLEEIEPMPLSGAIVAAIAYPDFKLQSLCKAKGSCGLLALQSEELTPRTLGRFRGHAIRGLN